MPSSGRSLAPGACFQVPVGLENNAIKQAVFERNVNDECNYGVDVANSPQVFVLCSVSACFRILQQKQHVVR